MSYYRGFPQQQPQQGQHQRGRYNNYNGDYSNGNQYQQGQQAGQQWRDDRNYYRAGRPQQQAYVAPQQYARSQPQAYANRSPPPEKSPRTEAKDILDDVRSSKEQKARAFKILLDGARNAPHSARSVSALTTAFPLFASEQQEEVIDFVYDLCEDRDSNVRIQGYRTIVELSKSVPTWTRRNADVLVQLLQSDSAEELVVIREALVSHIRTDPVAAIEVITEHMARSGEAEEKTGDVSQGAMKRLVLDFLKTPEAAKVRTEKCAAGSPAEISFNAGVSDTLLFSLPRDAKDLLGLVEALPSWTNQLQPNPFRTPAITSLLDRTIALAHKPEDSASDAAAAMYALAEKAVEGGNGDSRAFIRFWAHMGWKDWSVAEDYEYGQAKTLLRWLKVSMVIWEDLRKGRRSDDPVFDERILAAEVATTATDLLHSAANTFEKEGAVNQERMWVFLDTILAVFTRLSETRMDLQQLRDAFLEEPVRKMIRFAYETQSARGTGLNAETLRMLKSIASKSDVIYRDLKIHAPIPDHLLASRRLSQPSPSASIKRNAEGLQISSSASRAPVKIDRDRPGNREPPRAPLSMIRSHLLNAEASPVPTRNESVPPRGFDLIDSPSEGRPVKRPKLTVEGNDEQPARSLSLLERINGGKPINTPINGAQPAASEASQPRSLAERLGLGVKGAATLPAKPDDRISIRGAAGGAGTLASRLSRPETPTSLLSRIGMQTEGGSTLGGSVRGRK